MLFSSGAKPKQASPVDYSSFNLETTADVKDEIQDMDVEPETQDNEYEDEEFDQTTIGVLIDETVENLNEDGNESGDVGQQEENDNWEFEEEWYDEPLEDPDAKSSIVSEKKTEAAKSLYSSFTLPKNETDSRVYYRKTTEDGPETVPCGKNPLKRLDKRFSLFSTRHESSESIITPLNISERKKSAPKIQSTTSFSLFSKNSKGKPLTRPSQKTSVSQTSSIRKDRKSQGTKGVNIGRRLTPKTQCQQTTQYSLFSNQASLIPTGTMQKGKGKKRS